MTGGLPLSSLDLLEIAHVVSLTVLDDMRLVIEPQEIARDAEHNSATFRIVQQPASLDQFVCRAEVATVQGTTYRLVEGGEFSLTSDIAVQGTNTLQLVYSDGGDIVRKTYKTPFHVSSSINAVDPSEPEYENGIGQLQRACFANAVGDDTGIQFYNVNSQPLDFVAYPPGQGGGIDEATADLLYVRRDGANTMSGDQRLIPATNIDDPIGIQIGGRQARIQWNSGLLLQKGAAGEDVYVADVNGSSRSPVITQQTGDARYLTPAVADNHYLMRAGGQMQGPLITVSGGSLTNPGLGIGDNATGFYRSGGALLLSVGGALYAQWLQGPPSVMFTVPLNMATYGINNVADPRPDAAGAMDAVNRRSMDAAIAAVPRPVVPAIRTYVPSEVTIGNTPTEFFNQPFFTNNNDQRTILVTVYPQFAAGSQASFYDLEYTTGLSAGLFETISIYPTPTGFMGTAPICFAVTVTPSSSQIQVQLLVRQISNQTTFLTQIGSRANQRSYVIIQEMSQ